MFFNLGARFSLLTGNKAVGSDNDQSISKLPIFVLFVVCAFISTRDVSGTSLSQNRTIDSTLSLAG